MILMSSPNPDLPAGSLQLPTTSWSMIVSACGQHTPMSRDLLSNLCAIYWNPVYVFVRHRGFDADRARDYTQSFFTSLLEKNILESVNQSKGRFRSFLLASVNHFVLNELDREGAAKRGGAYQFLPLDAGCINSEAKHEITPEVLFEYHWALCLLDRTLERLRSAYQGSDFDVLKPLLLGEAERGQLGSTAERLGLTEGALKVAVHRLRRRYREILRSEIAATLTDPAQVEAEIQHLLTVFTRCKGHSEDL
jgi:DNA-directed RNA polymerase specialized sigma24 family protein